MNLNNPYLIICKIDHDFRIVVFPQNGNESKWQNRIRMQVNVTPELEWMRKAVGINE